MRVIPCDEQGQALFPEGFVGFPAQITASVTWGGASSVSMGTSWLSDVVSLSGRRYKSVQLVWTATNNPIGTLSEEVSNDNANWGELSESVVDLESGAGASNVMWTDRAADYLYVRWKYVCTSGGSGATCTGTFVSKG